MVRLLQCCALCITITRGIPTTTSCWEFSQLLFPLPWDWLVHSPKVSIWVLFLIFWPSSKVSSLCCWYDVVEFLGLHAVVLLQILDRIYSFLVVNGDSLISTNCTHDSDTLHSYMSLLLYLRGKKTFCNCRDIQWKKYYSINAYTFLYFHTNIYSCVLYRLEETSWEYLCTLALYN